MKIAGPFEALLRSNSKGEIRIEGPAGYYTFQVISGCTEKLEVLAGGSGRGGIAAGQTGTGELVVRWRHRVAPSAPVYASLTPYWPPGETIELRYDVVDRCIEGGPARLPGASYPTFVFQPGPNLRIVGQPSLKADDKGFGYVRVTCVREGPAELALLDSKNPTDRLDLVTPGTAGDTPSCRNP